MLYWRSRWRKALSPLRDVAVLPEVVGNQMADLRRLELPSEPPARDIWMGYHRDSRNLQRLRAFIEMVTQHVGKK